MNSKTQKNLDASTVDSFGDEWERFDQSALTEEEGRKIFEEYFAVFPWASIDANASGFDMGCGSGRWARFVAPRVGHLHCIDPSNALEMARRALAGATNVTFHAASVDDCTLPSGSQDFGYSLGVLHHVPDTAAAIRSCVDMLKPGAPFLVYLYYAFDGRSAGFRLLWRMSDLMRKVICRLPPAVKNLVTDAMALLVYLPLAKAALYVEKLNFNVEGMPLAYYRTHSFYTMRTDSRDRFGTPLERRFTKAEIEAMMLAAGLAEISFSEGAPYWCAVGRKQPLPGSASLA